MKKLVFKVTAVMCVVLLAYLYFDATVSADQLVLLSETAKASTINSKQVFESAYQAKYVSVIGNEEAGKVYDMSGGSITVNIDTALFTANSIRLNTEIYGIANEIVNSEHLSKCYQKGSTPLFRSFKKFVNPLIPIALTLNEMGICKDVRETWSSAIYSKPMKAEVDLDKLNIANVNMDTYLSNDVLEEYTYCGPQSHKCLIELEHKVSGKGNSDSLGPLQILRGHVLKQTDKRYNYPCGAVCEDLMRWDDNVQWWFHENGDFFSGEMYWNKDYEVKNVYELVAIIGVSHNMGFRWKAPDAPNGSWTSPRAIFALCEKITSAENVKIMQDFVDDWYEGIAKAKLTKGEDFAMAGEEGGESLVIKDMYKAMGVDWSMYASNGYTNRQAYPLKAILGYMALEKFYTSGGAG